MKYCKEHQNMVRFNAIGVSECKQCGKEFMTANSPPNNSVCSDCSEKYNLCEFCGEEIEDDKD